MSRPRPYSDPAEATLSGQARRRESSWPARYDMLDGWRGIAALSVVLDHLGLWSFGFDAVMLFFVISGYCITAAAEAAFRKGMGFRQFMWRRVRRIYPPYLFAILFFYLTRMVRSAAGGAGFHATFTAWVQNLTLTQWLTLLRHPQANPATNPTLFVNTFWSLCYEEQFYLVMGVIFIIPLMLGRRRLILGLFAIGLGWNLASPRLCHGFFLDYWPHFAVGSLLFYRLCRLPNTKIRLLYDAALVAAVVALAMLAWRENLSAATVGRRPFREAFVTCGFALTLIALRPFDDGFKASRGGKALMWLGLISYSLYLIHRFNQHLVGTITIHLAPRSSPGAVIGAAELCGHVLVASVFWYFCERPFLNHPDSESRRRPIAARRGNCRPQSGWARWTINERRR